MNTAKWFLGSQHKPPRHVPTVQGHRVTACLHLTEGQSLSVTRLIETLDRIFPLSVTAQKIARDSGMAISYDDRRARDSGLEQKLTSELATYWPLPGVEDDDTLTAAQQSSIS
jgi:hypothetical protein